MWFPETPDPEKERLAAVILDLRRELFLRCEFQRSQERVWETEEEEKRRERRNEEALKKWDLQTRRLILGKPE